MKFITFILLFVTLGAFSQEQEFENFKKEINFYIDFTLQKFDSLPLNTANQNKFRKKVDDVFKEFVIHTKSHQYEKLVIAKGDEKTKFARLDGRGELYVTSFIAGNKTYVVYGYKLQAKQNFYIKDVEKNVIVFEGDSKSYSVDNIYLIDPTHFLLVKKTGDRRTSREAIVMLLLTDKQIWKTTQSFTGMAFGQVPGEYFTKKLAKKRTSFQLECEMEFTMSNPEDINRINFDATTKTISYKQYHTNKKPVLITAKWENNFFTIDDYNVDENLSADSPAVPR